MRKKTKKRWKSLALASMLTVFTLAGCGTDATEKSDGTTEIGETATNTENYAQMTAQEFTKVMGNGINLGNTMEAYGKSVYGITGTVSDYETSWGQPVTTEEMIQGMKTAGFDTLRIPVAWTNMMDYENGDYTIPDEFLDRVDEIIGWAVDADMFVIVDAHWDGGWWGMFGSPDTATRDAAMELYVSMWEQIAERYKDYDEHLLFESANEEVGSRLNDEIDGVAGTLTEDECYETAAKIHQTFVDTVRATGGNNSNRFLVIPGYNTDIDATLDSRFVMPEDTVDSKLLIDIHYYLPWNFTGDDTKQTNWGIVSEYQEMNRAMEKLSVLAESGYGIIVGEHGPLPHEDGTFREDMVTYVDHLLDNCDKYNFVPVLWDRGDLYSKTECKIADEGLAELYASRNYAAEQGRDEATYLAELETEMADELANAPTEREVVVDMDEVGDPTAWIMWNGGFNYSVGDTYNPDDCSEGVVATDAIITGEGTYTVALDFTGTEEGKTSSITFAAIGLSWGEVLFPGYYIENISIKVNGEPYELTAKSFTTTDDKMCTRVNLINEWVTSIPDEARTSDGDLTDVSAVIIDKETFVEIETLEITFDYIAP